MTQTVRKFLFDTSFDDPTKVRRGKEPEPPPEPTFSTADLERAQVEAFSAGRDEGIAEARAGNECLAGDAIARIADRLSQIDRDVATFQAHTLRQTTHLAVEVVRRMMPALVQGGGIAEIEAAIETCLRSQMHEPRIVVRVADALLDTVRDRLDGITKRTGFGGRVILLADETVAPADCRVEWADGGAERDTARLGRDIDAALARILPADAAGGIDGQASHTP